MEHSLPLDATIPRALVEPMGALTHDVAAHPQQREARGSRPGFSGCQQCGADARTPRALGNDESGQFGMRRILELQPRYDVGPADDARIDFGHEHLAHALRTHVCQARADLVRADRVSAATADPQRASMSTDDIA